MCGVWGSRNSYVGGCADGNDIVAGLDLGWLHEVSLSLNGRLQAQEGSILCSFIDLRGCDGKSCLWV